MSKSTYRATDNVNNDSIPVPTSTSATPCNCNGENMTIEEMKECVRKLNTQIELREREAERAAAKKAAAEKAAAEKAAAKKAAEEAAAAKKAAEEAAAAEAAAKAKATKANYAEGFNGPGMAYRYLNRKLAVYSLTADIWKAKRISNGTYDPIWVWYSDGKIDHILSDEELEEYIS